MTGGAGFIGTALVKRLIEHNKIVIYDTFQRDAISRTGLESHPNLKMIKGDIMDAKKLTRAMDKANIIIHLAAVAGIDTVIKSPTRTINVNMIGTYNCLNVAIRLKKVDRFIDFSTSEVYGSYAYKLDERDSTNMGAVGEARWTYAVSKLAGEHLAHSYNKEFGLPVVSIRPFNIYGPGQVGEGAIHMFVTSAIRNKDLFIHGDGDQIRSWCYIDDIVDSVMLAIEKKQAVGHVFNIGNPKGTITILSLAEKIRELAGSSSRILFKPKNYVDVELRIPDVQKAREVLGFNPKVMLTEGIEKTVSWYRKNIYDA